jgi:hypothetical protein
LSPGSPVATHKACAGVLSLTNAPQLKVTFFSKSQPRRAGFICFIIIFNIFENF